MFPHQQVGLKKIDTCKPCYSANAHISQLVLRLGRPEIAVLQVRLSVGPRTTADGDNNYTSMKGGSFTYAQSSSPASSEVGSYLTTVSEDRLRKHL